MATALTQRGMAGLLATSAPRPSWLCCWDRSGKPQGSTRMRCDTLEERKRGSNNGGEEATRWQLSAIVTGRQLREYLVLIRHVAVSWEQRGVGGWGGGCR